jgi:hypothetical protein
MRMCGGPEYPGLDRLYNLKETIDPMPTSSREFAYSTKSAAIGALPWTAISNSAVAKWPSTLPCMIPFAKRTMPITREKRVQIESDLRVALRESQLFVEYPVRWRHPLATAGQHSTGWPAILPRGTLEPVQSVGLASAPNGATHFATGAAHPARGIILDDGVSAGS